MAESPVAEPKPRAELDLMPKLAKFLDPHLVIAVFVNFVKELKIYDEAQMMQLELQLTMRTRLADFAGQVYESLREMGKADPALADQVAAAQAAVEPDSPVYAAHVAACGPLLELVGLNEPTAALQALREAGNFHPEYLGEHHGVSDAHIEGLARFAKWQYDCGLYRSSLAFLDYYEELKYPDAKDVPLEVLWGKFAAAMMDGEALWDKADEMRAAIVDALRRRQMPDIVRLQNRTWLLHWSLFILANCPEKRDALVEFYFADDNLQAVALTCPWMLRYLVVAAMGHRRKHILARNLTRLLSAEALALKDPMIRFLQSLLVDFDFEAAQAVMEDCGAAIATDFFLFNMVTVEEFTAGARTFLFEIYCRVHQKIDLRLLAGQVHMDVDAAEKWVVGLIRSAHLDAKVDSQAKTIQMLQPATSVHWQIVDKTRDIAGRTKALLEAVESAAQQRY